MDLFEPHPIIYCHSCIPTPWLLRCSLTLSINKISSSKFLMRHVKKVPKILYRQFKNYIRKRLFKFLNGDQPTFPRSCWEYTPISTLAKYQVKYRNKIGEINDTRIYVKNFFTGGKTTGQSRQNPLRNNLVQLHRFSPFTPQESRDQYKRKYKHGITKCLLPLSKDIYTINPVLKPKKDPPLTLSHNFLFYLTLLSPSSWMIF